MCRFSDHIVGLMQRALTTLVGRDAVPDLPLPGVTELVRHSLLLRLRQKVAQTHSLLRSKGAPGCGKFGDTVKHRRLHCCQIVYTQSCTPTKL